jgi:hypothetical protein
MIRQLLGKPDTSIPHYRWGDPQPAYLLQRVEIEKTTAWQAARDLAKTDHEVKKLTAAQERGETVIKLHEQGLTFTDISHELAVTPSACGRSMLGP